MSYNEIWDQAKIYLKKPIRKDFVLHTKGVVKAMELILQEIKEDHSIFIPAAMLHDVGWAKVPVELQKDNSKKSQLKALKLHIKYAPEIIIEILGKINYDPIKINKIIQIVTSHKFCDPTELDKQLLIDADALSDVFKEQFYSDVKTYNSTPQKNYEFRRKNIFYTKTAKKLFDIELEQRKNEIFNY